MAALIASGPAVDDQGGGRVKILVVDDLPEKHLVFRSVLEELGQTIVSAYSGSQALRCVLEEEFAVILLDVNMPDMDGLETASLIRKYKKTAQTPIVFVTAFVEEAQMIRGYVLGAVDYISSPVVPEILRSKVKVFVDMYRLNRELRQQMSAREALARSEMARSAAEQATQRAHFLSSASQVLSRSLDIDTTLAGLLGLATPALADFAAVALVNDRGERAKVWASAGSPAESGLPEPRDGQGARISDLVSMALKGREPLQLEGPLYLQEVEGEAGRVPAIDPANSVAVFPIYGGERAFGALVLAVFGQRKFGVAEMALANEVVSRALIAMENATLYETIQEADQRKNEFLAMLAHELRNPLAPIRNAVHVLQRGGSSEKNVHWAGEIIGRQVDHLATLVDDLLDVSRIARGKVAINPEALLLSEVVDHALETSRPILESRRHQLSLSLPKDDVSFRGDMIRLAQVLSNLLNNAAKFTPPDGKISLSGTVADGVLRITVKDNGIGMDMQLLPRIFDLFTQGDQTLDRSEGGLGIGLTLVKHLVELHGGSIEASSGGRGRGAEFILILPGAELASRPASRNPPGQDRPTGYSADILVVDDVMASAESLKQLLEIEGHRVSLATDGQSALEMAHSVRPDVIVLDIGLPGMSGFQVAKALRSSAVFSDTLLVALTGYGAAEDRVKGADAGFNHYLVKPADIPTLLSIIGARATLKQVSDRSLSMGTLRR